MDGGSTPFVLLPSLRDLIRVALGQLFASGQHCDIYVVHRMRKPSYKDHWSLSALNQVVCIDILTYLLFDTPYMRVRIVAEVSVTFIMFVRPSDLVYRRRSLWTGLHLFRFSVPSRSRRPSSVPILSILQCHHDLFLPVQCQSVPSQCHHDLSLPVQCQSVPSQCHHYLSLPVQCQSVPSQCHHDLGSLVKRRTCLLFFPLARGSTLPSPSLRPNLFSFLPPPTTVKAHYL